MKKMNFISYDNLLLTMADDVSFDQVDKANSTDYSDGDTRTTR